MLDLSLILTDLRPNFDHLKKYQFDSIGHSIYN